MKKKEIIVSMMRSLSKASSHHTKEKKGWARQGMAKIILQGSRNKQKTPEYFLDQHLQFSTRTLLNTNYDLYTRNSTDATTDKKLSTIKPHKFEA